MSDETFRTPDPTAPDLPDWLEQVASDQPAPVKQRFSTTSIALLLGVVAVLAVIAYALNDRNKPTPTAGRAPDFAITTWTLDQLAMPGERLTLAALKDKTIVLNFWASWCIPCQQEAPMFERIWNEYRDRDVIFLGVNTEDTDSAVFKYIQDFGLTYPHAPDEGGRMEEAYRITGIPETFVINGNGEIVKHFISSPNASDLRAAIDRALAG